MTASERHFLALNRSSYASMGREQRPVGHTGFPDALILTTLTITIQRFAGAAVNGKTETVSLLLNRGAQFFQNLEG
jgi:hypothetical protein